jgi:hypothetical protein
MGDGYHTRRQWHFARGLAEKGRATSPVGRHWVRNYAARHRDATVHTSRSNWHGDDAAGRYGRKLKEPEEQETEGGKTVMIGSVPCKLSTEIHVNGQRVDRGGVEKPGDSNTSPKPKRARMLTAEGREVVGPGYTERACIGMHEHADGNMQGGIRLKGLAYQACGVPSEEVNLGGSSRTQGKERMTSSGRKSWADGEAAVTVAKKIPNPRWCPSGLSKTQRRQLQKLRQVEIAAAREEAARDAWFNEVRPMTEPKNTWREKRLATEVGDVDSSSSSASEGKSSGAINMTAQSAGAFEVNMVFTILQEFRSPETKVAELALGAERAVLKKPSEAW